MTARSVRVSAPAKVNLYLGVHNQKDERGYHRVDSVMTAIGLADIVEISPAERLSVRTVPEADFPMESNTAYRAAVAMGEAFGRDASFDIVIEKRIPIRAGLGGPSTDAAAVILGLCRLWGVDPQSPVVAELARGIGADVPFFLYGPPAYFAGAGDVMEEQFSPLAGVPVALVKPPASGSSTVEAYRLFDEDPIAPAPLEPMLRALRSGELADVLGAVFNNLAPAARCIEPETGEICAWLSEQPGVRIVEVSGSGACVFAVCESAAAAQDVTARAASERAWWSHATEMVGCGPVVEML